MSLGFGILASIISLLWFLQMLGSVGGGEGEVFFSLADGWLSSLSNNGTGFVATLLYGVLVLYMQICLIKGSCVFGIRIPYLLKVHPMVVNKTYMNSLLFNCNLMLLASCAISIQSLWAFPSYFGNGSFLASVYDSEILQLPLFGTFYGKKIYMIAMEALILLVLVLAVGKAVWLRCRGKDKKDRKEQK